MLNKQEVFDFLKDSGICYEITEHEAVYKMEELTKLAIPYPGADAKNLFLCDDKKQNYYLITVNGGKKVDLKRFRKDKQLRSLSFASEHDLMRIMGLKSGSVTPLGILNDEQNKVKVFLDEAFFTSCGMIGVHPNDNTATVWLKTEDLVHIIKEHGNEIEVVSL